MRPEHWRQHPTFSHQKFQLNPWRSRRFHKWCWSDDRSHLRGRSWLCSSTAIRFHQCSIHCNKCWWCQCIRKLGLQRVTNPCLHHKLQTRLAHHNRSMCPSRFPSLRPYLTFHKLIRMDQRLYGYRWLRSDCSWEFSPSICRAASRTLLRSKRGWGLGKKFLLEYSLLLRLSRSSSRWCSELRSIRQRPDFHHHQKLMRGMNCFMSHNCP